MQAPPSYNTVWCDRMADPWHNTIKPPCFEFTIQFIVRVSMRKIFILISLIILAGLQAEALRIIGSAPDYAGRTLEFFSVSDPVSKTPVPCFMLNIDDQGKFNAEAAVLENLYCYSDFGIYRGRMILVPGRDITLELPPLREKRFEESKNPYFEPVEIWLKTGGDSGNEITNMISQFDTRFYRFTDTYFNQLYYKQMKSYADTIRGKLDKEFGKNRDPLFREHLRIRMASLEADVMRSGRERIAGELKDLPPGAWFRPAFTDFLNRLFVNTLSTESKSPTGSKLRLWVARENLTELRNWTSRFTAAPSPLSDVILLKLLHDAWYSGEFSKTAIWKMVTSGYFTSHNQKEIRQIAAHLSEKISYLQPGTTAPEISLPSVDLHTWCSAANTGQYLYILFADLEIPICQEQVKYLKTMAEKTGNPVQFLVVLSPSKKVSNEEFMSRHQIPGIMVTDTPNRKTGRDYRVRSYPSAFLLDSRHRVVLAPARTPLDGFEFQFEDMIKR